VPKQIRHACRFLRSNERIAGYLAAVERNAKLLLDVRRALPPPLDERCLHAALDAGVLTLVTDSPVWSSRLRFFAPELQRGLARHYGPIATCRIRVQPRTVKPPSGPGANPRHKLSPRTAQHLMEAAAGIEDTELAAALRRLAKAGTRGG
jgi:hypothetical protein